MLTSFNFGPDAEWTVSETQEKSSSKGESKKRKLDQEAGFMRYDPSHVRKDAGEFVRVQTKTRLNLLRAAREAKGESILDNSVLNLGNQVITTNLGYKKSKKRKNYYNRYSKQPVQTKTKFETIAQIRSEWKEIAKIDFPDLKKVPFTLEKTKLSQTASEHRKFKTSFLKNRKKNFPKIRKDQQGFLPPHDILNDQELMGLFKSQEIPKEKIGIFISENALYTLGAINISKFPFVLKAKREGNKILISYDITAENCFLFWESYRESTTENYIDSEKKIQELSMISTLILESFQTETINPPEKSFNSTDKKELEKLKEEALAKEFKRQENFKIMKFDLNKDVVVYSRLGLEGQDSKGNEILVKALYDMPKLLNNKNKGNDVFLDCIQYNSFRITKWMVQAYLADIQQIYLGFVTKSKQSGAFPVVKVERKSLNQLSQVFNTNIDTIPKNLAHCFSHLKEKMTDGQFALHKGPFKVDLVIYRE